MVDESLLGNQEALDCRGLHRLFGLVIIFSEPSDPDHEIPRRASGPVDVYQDLPAT